MKKVLLILFLLCSVLNILQAQNSICQVDIKEQNMQANLVIEFDNGEKTSLETSYMESQIQSIDYYGNSKFILILIKPRSNYQEYIINGAFKFQNEWIQDYKDRSYFKVNSGLACSQILGIKIKDEQTLRVEYETTSVLDGYSKTETNLILGKHSLFEEVTKIHVGY